MTEIDNAVQGEVLQAEKDGRLVEWASHLSDDARLCLRLLPYGGHVRFRPSALAAPPQSPQVSNTLAWGGPPPKDEDDGIEGFTIEAAHLVSFLRAGGEGRQASRDRVTSALTELMLRGLAKVFQDEAEAPRYAATEEGWKVQAVLQ